VVVLTRAGCGQMEEPIITDSAAKIQPKDRIQSCGLSELSADLIAKRSLFLSLLALRANREGLSHARKVRLIANQRSSTGDNMVRDGNPCQSVS
jgi:hypothetical protein